MAFKIKLIAFDLDGTLFNANILHYYSLNKALKHYCNYEISLEEHYEVFDGLSTKQKLNKLSDEGLLKLSEEDKLKINELKQEYTLQEIDRIVTRDERLIQVFNEIRPFFKLCCVSNAVRPTVDKIINRLGLTDFFDFTLSNNDVRNPKPHGEPYIRAMIKGNVFPEEILIVEDNEKGWNSAFNSGGNLMKVKSPEDVTVENILMNIRRCEE